MLHQFQQVIIAFKLYSNKCDYTYCECLIKHYKDLPCWKQEVGNNIYWDCDKSIITDQAYATMQVNWLTNIKTDCLQKNLICYAAIPNAVKGKFSHV